jgi:hypothetical protein
MLSRRGTFPRRSDHVLEVRVGRRAPSAHLLLTWLRSNQSVDKRCSPRRNGSGQGQKSERLQDRK